MARQKPIDELRLALKEELAKFLGSPQDPALAKRITDLYNKLDAQLDVTLTVLARLQRWGREVTPVWVHGSEITAPAANTELVSRVVPTGRVGYIYGFFISAGEPNDFRINWTSGGTARSIRIVFPGMGSLQHVDLIPLNEGFPADAGSTISITNINSGGSGIVYQARLLIGEI